MTGGQHNAEFERLVERRRKFIDGLDANKGEINLDIFEDFYPDKAHFVYELLQNAEDAGATEIAFTLTPEKLVCEHNGRAFALADVTSITGLHDSTKANAQDKIGKFGVGFKSVFVYTQAPSIHSGDFAFRIVQLILPEPIAPDGVLNGRTRFEFPFDNPKKPPQEAYDEVASGLNELDEKTLLFLSNLGSVTWRIGTQSAGEVLRAQHSDFHFEVLKEIGGKTASSSHFLKFDQAVPGLEKQRVAVAFPLDILPGVRSFDSAARLADQLKIIPAEPGSVAVFFPAVKEASGLRFHLHGPFVPELSRASIKETKANTPLFKQLAALAAASLHRIKEFGLLTPDFLAALPNPQDQIPPRYQDIRTAIIAAMKAHPLTPTHGKGHAPASNLIQARASLKELLSEADIAFLVDHKGEPPLWAIGATQRNNRIDQFLSGLEIRDWGLAKFIETLRKHARDEDGLHPVKPDEKTLSWLKQKSAAWMQELYALLHVEAQNVSHQLKTLRIVRLSDGNLSRADQAFFATGTTAADVPVVDMAVYASGASKSEKDDAKQFLSEIGVREIGEAEQIELILKRRYTHEAEIPDDKTYLQDLKRFAAFVEETGVGSLFSEFYIFQGADDAWHTPEGIYLDRPYLDTGLSAYYGALTGDGEPKALHARYEKCGIANKKLAEFAKEAGAVIGLEIKQDNCNKNPERQYLYSAGGNWTWNGVNRDYFIPRLDEMLKTPSLELSHLIWKTLTPLPVYSEYWKATYRCNASHNAHVAASRLVHELRAAKWIPQGDGEFVRPADASREFLPKGFPFDPGYALLKAIQFGETAVQRSTQAQQKDAAAKSLGFNDAAEAERARRFSDLPQAEQEKFLAEYESRNKPALPDRPLANPERRAQHVREQALNAPDKQSEIRERSVSIGREDVKAQADTYLREHYRNADGEVTCQICKGPLPFKIDGSEYFEVVEFLPELTKRHPQNYLALCPNHSAMYRLVNGSRETMREAFQTLTDNELEVVLAEQDLTVYFSRTHIIDLNAVLDAEDSFPVGHQ
ncbi:hypothetical protein PY365_11490 [Roseiarcaceae bacterium H3SJ34-1]|uniref:sacsin N-terminal ATP-binding-like domain-containing protein n=1 Tax=Terripilifer ovatus TaxID=3032367 RepID=UPI003AB95AE7|nr:hypothetical protein [Roseiarcaceae bacterium H3SJ34-1]